jgi:hypothetical protein
MTDNQKTVSQHIKEARLALHFATLLRKEGDHEAAAEQLHRAGYELEEASLYEKHDGRQFTWTTGGMTNHK